MYRVRKSIGSNSRPPAPSFTSVLVPEWMQTLHHDDARHEHLRRAKLKRDISKLDDLEGADKNEEDDDPVKSDSPDDE